MSVIDRVWYARAERGGKYVRVHIMSDSDTALDTYMYLLKTAWPHVSEGDTLIMFGNSEKIACVDHKIKLILLE